MKVGFFEEEEGVKSNIRLMSFLSLLQAFFMSDLLALRYLGDAPPPTIDYYYISIIALFVIGAFAPKVVQKFAEMKVVK